MIISLTGFMGCGKSSIGKVLSKLLGCTLIDSDDWIEQREGRKIKEIFATDGEAHFRKLEVNAIKELVPVNADSQRKGSIDLILSLGGGTVTTPEAAEIIHGHTLCIYLKASTETLVDNLTEYPGDRPMLGAVESRETLRRRIEELMTKRAAIYESTASMILDIDGKDYEQVAEEIKERIKL